METLYKVLHAEILHVHVEGIVNFERKMIT